MQDSYAGRPGLRAVIMIIARGKDCSVAWPNHSDPQDEDSHGRGIRGVSFRGYRAGEVASSARTYSGRHVAVASCRHLRLAADVTHCASNPIPESRAPKVCVRNLLAVVLRSHCHDFAPTCRQLSRQFRQRQDAVRWCWRRLQTLNGGPSTRLPALPGSPTAARRRTEG